MHMDKHANVKAFEYAILHMKKYCAYSNTQSVQGKIKKWSIYVLFENPKLLGGISFRRNVSTFLPKLNHNTYV